ncbi:hypothetical protein BV22DRAFT_1106303 [Leucogyrophana mollusca]|uniref:Uncharacterized protein n=1 Tax=Leucogyrophana mollusca TaxID=85980 RepID=A0ACB8BEC0_9AGAM|nr:hypothetical protein BV22DRAFT_1106303 [Leucogyrophana mollusca]
MSTSTVSADLLYFVPPADGSRPFINTNADLTTGKRARGTELGRSRAPGKEGGYTLDTAGFQYCKGAAKHSAFSDDDDIKREYYPESVRLLKELTGASRVVLFDHTVRRHRPGDHDTDETKRQPVSQVHIDQTPASATARVHRHLPADEAQELVNKRFQIIIINLWRPITHPAIDHPLALCDYRSVDAAGDLVPVALIYPDREGETMGVKFNADHRWKYQREMRQDEVVLIKCVAVFMPHTGFEDKTAAKDAPLRESIELRALVFYD